MSPQTIVSVYELIQPLPRFDQSTQRLKLPDNGIYFFFETGEALELRGQSLERVVRIGINREQGNFRKRIRRHYGNVRSLGGRMDKSTFRWLVGGALLTKENPHDSRLQYWRTKERRTFADLEARVSAELRERFSFACIEVPLRAERLSLEKRLIGLFAQQELGRPSPDWLGQYSTSEEVLLSGLWNSDHIHHRPLDADELSRLAELANIERS